MIFVLRRSEIKDGSSSSDKDLPLVYKEELMAIGRMALKSLTNGESHFEDHKGDFNKTPSIKFDFLSIKGGGSKRLPCVR